MSKKDTKYLKFNGSSWVFQKRLTPAEQEHLGVKTKVHNKSLETDSRKEACNKRDVILALKIASKINNSAEKKEIICSYVIK